MQWFKHDIGAYKGKQIQALRLSAGSEAIDLYYAIVEELYEAEGSVTFSEKQVETKCFLFALQLVFKRFCELLEFIEDVGLLDVSRVQECGETVSVTVSSRRVTRVVEEMRALSETRRQAGKKGGRPKKSESKQKANANQTESKRKANAPKTIKTIKTNKTIEKEVPKGTSKKSAKFSKPTVDELAAYAAERGATRFDAQRFYDWYESNGWKVGRNPMRDWKAAVRNWIARDSEKNNPKSYEEVGNELFSEYNRS